MAQFAASTTTQYSLTRSSALNRIFLWLTHDVLKMRRGRGSIVDSAKRGSSSSYTTTESDSNNCDESSCESSTAKKVKRQLTVATFEKWQ